MKVDAYFTERYGPALAAALNRAGCTCIHVPFAIYTTEPNGRGEVLSLRFSHKTACPAFGTEISAAQIGQAV